MAIASYFGAEIVANTNTFQVWLDRTNSLISDMANNVVTIGNNNIGDVKITGNLFTSNTLFVGTGISGGDDVTSAPFEIVSNVTFTTTSDVLMQSDVRINDATGIFLVDNSNTTIRSSVFNVESNTVFTKSVDVVNADASFIGGNTTIETAIVTDLEANTISAGTIETTGDITANGTITSTEFSTTSDARVKENIEDIQSPLEIAKQLRGVYFKYKGENQRKVGFVAQEVEKILPEVVHTNSDGLKSVNYGNITALLLEAIHELDSQISEK